MSRGAQPNKTLDRKIRLRESLLLNPMSTPNELFELNKKTETRAGHLKSDAYSSMRATIVDLDWLLIRGDAVVDDSDRWQITPGFMERPITGIATRQNGTRKRPWSENHRPPTEEDRRRFEAKYHVDDAGCFIWDGASNGSRGTFTLGKVINAHKAAWILYRGEIPFGKLILHKCNVSICVNPDHLYLGTAADNTRDMLMADRGRRGKLGLPHGVVKMRGKFQARFNGRSYGTYETTDEAEVMAASAMVRYFIGGYENS